MIQSPAARRAIPLLADQLGPDVARAVTELLDDAGLLARPTARVGGPYPITVRRAGIGVEIDHHVMMTAHLAQLADDPARTAFRLEEIEAASRTDRDALLDALLTDLGGSEQVLSSRAAVLLADQITDLAAPLWAVPAERRAS